MPEPYRPRLRARLDDADLGGVTAKVDWIDALGEGAPPIGLLRAALDHAAGILPGAMAAEGGDEGAAFMVLHRGRLGTWLLMDWWAHGDILCQRLARAESGATAFATVGDRPLVACVWEMEVLADERAAWVAHAMSSRPDRAAWRAA